MLKEKAAVSHDTCAENDSIALWEGAQGSEIIFDFNSTFCNISEALQINVGCSSGLCTWTSLILTFHK